MKAIRKYPKFHIFQDQEGKWRWHLKSANGRIIAQGESHGSERDAKRAAETVASTLASGWKFA
jgi:uncharacterized protein YegP (UPF0339 family)